MHKTNQLVAVQNHAAAPGLAAQDIMDVFFKRVVFIVQRNEGVALRIDEHAQRSRQFAGDSLQTAGGCRSHQDTDDGGIKWSANFVLRRARQFGCVDEQRLAVR